MSSEVRLLSHNITTTKSEPSLQSEAPLLNPSASCSPRASQEQKRSRSITPSLENDTDTIFRSSHYTELPTSSEKYPSSWIIAIQEPWRWLSRWLPKGWRSGLAFGAVLSSCALIINIVIVIIASNIVRREQGNGLGIAPVRKGRCKELERMELGIHLAINFIGTLLLGAGNYCMQCLVAPTRLDIDRAHRKGEWLDVGVPSLRNFRFIAPLKLVLWTLLGLSSIPLHLFYNSTFFMSFANHSYNIYVASEEFEKGSWIDPIIADAESMITQKRVEKLGVPRGDSFYERLNNEDCIENYANIPLPGRRSVVLVTSTNLTESNNFLNHSLTHKGCGILEGYRVNPSTCLSNSSLYSVSLNDGRMVPQNGRVPNWFSWICSQDSSYAKGGTGIPNSLCGDGHWRKIRSNADNWNVWGFKIEYCLSEKVENECTLHVGTSFLTVVIVFNVVKLLIISFVAWRMTNKPLITIGDAAASFIRDPDNTTQGLCLLAKSDIIDQSSSFKRHVLRWVPGPKPYEAKERRRGKAASKTRWRNIVILTVISSSVVLGFYSFALQKLQSKYDRNDAKLALDIGLGTATPYTLITGWSIPSTGNAAILDTVLIANLPQTLLSMFYVLINGIFTNISIAEEWSRYAHQHRALRVSEPHGAQRSTYFLQVPYRFGIPLMVFSSFLHWIISQSIYAVKIDNQGGRDPFSVVTCGYSLLGMIFTVVAVLTLMMFVAVMGVLTLKPGIPLAGSCSAAISAACHAPKGTSECLPVMWGAIPDDEMGTEDHKKAGHCAFSNGPVEAPVEGQLYA